LKVAVTIGGQGVEPGKVTRLEIPVARLPLHTMLHLPVTVINGRRDGARLWLSAALHGDEINGMEVIRRVVKRIRPERLAGLLIAVPIVNVFGFINQSRYLPDRRDLNRSFPGSSGGSLASQLARLFMTEVVKRCSHGIDLHTAAAPRINLPQIRANLDDPPTRRCAEAFGAPVMLQSNPPKGALRGEATRRGITVLLYEAGESQRFNPDAIRTGVEGVLNVMGALGMIERKVPAPRRITFVAGQSKWIRARQSGVLYLKARLGEEVEKGALVAVIADPLGESAVETRAPFDGLVIGSTTSPLVHRGDAVLHLAGAR